MKKYLLIPLFIPFFLTGCSNIPVTTDQEVSLKQEAVLSEANRQTGLPNIINFQEKKLLKMIYELRDQENLVNYAYLYNEMSGKLVYLGECVGYGIPYSTQYSNPESVQKFVHDSGTTFRYDVLPQAEPNGLFMPSSASGTWVMLVDPSTKKPRPVYIEPNVLISPFQLTI